MAAFTQPAIPRFETERLRELYSLKLLDTQLEERFQRFTDLAADVFEVPISLISLIDNDRQWFKAVCGWNVREGNRSESFCAHAVAADKTLVVQDASQDTRFAGNPLVVHSPYIRFYAGAPVRGPSGLPLGTLCLIDSAPRYFSPLELARLERMAAMVEHEILQSYQIDHLRVELERNIYYDPLTTLPNQRLFMDRLEFALQLTAQMPSGRLLVALIDVDRFGAFNHLYGWEAGNTLLRSIAAGLSRDHPEPCTVAHWQDDQFVILYPHIPEHRDPTEFARSIQQTFVRPFRVAGRDNHIGVRIGLSIYPQHGRDAHELIRHAITAMRAVNPGYRVYSADLETNRTRRLELADRLRAAVELDQVELAYQAKLASSNCQLCGVEALARWKDPELGDIPADELFIVAEETGLVYRLGIQLLSKACRQSVLWADQALDVPVAVNLTASQLRHPDLVSQITRVLAETGLLGNQLMLEVTEESLVDVESTSLKMQELANFGIRFAIDDFGTGYSSFAYLAELPVDSIKIDRRFVHQLCTVGSGAKVVTAIIQLAHGLDMEVVAEGVETQAQASFLREAGCDEMQGYLFCKPLTPGALADYVMRL